VAAVEQQQPEPGLVPKVRRQAPHWEPRPSLENQPQAPHWEPRPSLENQPEAAPQEPHYHPGSNSVPAHRPEPEQALNFCIRSK
jgi:hypothetical protein